MNGDASGPPYADREDAGRRLGGLLLPYRAEEPIVLGMARGGVPVAAEVAERLGAPLDVLVVRKIGAPEHPEFAIGALSAEILRIDEPTVRRLGIPGPAIQRIVDAERVELARRERLYRKGRSAAAIRGRTILVIDDGLATGLSARVAVESVRMRGPKQVIFAAPVCAPEGPERLGMSPQHVVCAFVPPDFYAVGSYYEDFRPTGDDEVIARLEAADARIRQTRAHRI